MKTKLFTLLLAVAASIGTISATEGALPGVFTINAQGDLVVFSQGNLQYQAAPTPTWRFALNQYDTIGALNANISSTYDGWIDLFGWGTGNNPTLASEDNGDYANFTDWGVNKISNGGNKEDAWRALTKEEWEYLFNIRTNSSNLYGQATVAGVHGYVLLPDNWSTPSTVTWQGMPNNWTTNTYDINAWSTMEDNGAVFLPVAGYRNGTQVPNVGTNGNYWSSTPTGGEFVDFANYLSLLEDRLYTYNFHRCSGRSVRLVRDTIPCEDKTFEFTETARGSYVWNNVTYSTPGDYQQTFTLATGCDSTVTLHLSIYNYFVAGNGGGGSWCDGRYWSPNSSPMVNNTITFANVPAGIYEFKITDGQWGNGHEWAFGAVDATCSSANVLNGGDGPTGNIKLITSVTQDITITFDGTHICVFGAFDEPSVVVISSYTIVGDSRLVGSSWNVADDSNDMTQLSPGIFTLTKNNRTLVATVPYEYKAVGNHDYTVYQLPANGNNTISVTETGDYDVVFTLNINEDPNTLTAVVTKVPEDDPTAIRDVQSDNAQCAKVLRNGQLFIQRDGKTYTVQGQEVR